MSVVRWVRHPLPEGPDRLVGNPDRRTSFVSLDDFASLSAIELGPIKWTPVA